MLDDPKIRAEPKYLISFTEPGKRFVLCLHFNRSNSFLFASVVKMYQFKANDSEMKPYPLCLGNMCQVLEGFYTW